MRNRSDPRFNDPRFNNDEYLADVERKMLLSLGISPEEIGFDNPPLGAPVKQQDALK